MKLKNLFTKSNIVFTICSIVKLFCALHHVFNSQIWLGLLWFILALLDIYLIKLKSDEDISNNSK